MHLNYELLTYPQKITFHITLKKLSVYRTLCFYQPNILKLQTC